MRLSECEAAIILSMARGINAEGGLHRRGGPIQRLAAMTILWLRKQGWANEDLYVRDAGWHLRYYREERTREEEEAVAKLREDLARWDLTSA